MKELKKITLKEISANSFYQAISIYLKKTQVVNRKLSCSANVVFLKLNSLSCQIQVKSNLIESLKEISTFNVRNKLEELGIEFVESSLDNLKDFDDSNDGLYLSIDRMIPRSLQKFATCCIATLIGKYQKPVDFILKVVIEYL